jgi:hypothetical protein
MLYSYTHFIIQAFPRQALNREPADTYYKHTDQLPSFNLSLLFSNELGYASYQRLLGVTFTDDGSVYSIQDMFSERTLVFLAEDFTELMPLTLSSLYQPHRKLLRNSKSHQGSLATRNPTSLARLLPAAVHPGRRPSPGASLARSVPRETQRWDRVLTLMGEQGVSSGLFRLQGEGEGSTLSAPRALP